MASEFDTIQTQYVREAPEIEAQKIALLKSAQELYNQGLTLPAVEAAGLSATQQEAIEGAQGLQGLYDKYVTQGATTLGQGQTAMDTGIAAATGAAQAYDPRSAEAFMNPYQQAVIDESLKQINRQGAIAENQIGAQAVGAGAYGGTREGVQRAELGRNLAEQRNAAIINALQQGYGAAQQQAQQAFEAQQARQMQQAGLFGTLGQGLGQLGVQQAALGQTGQQMALADINALSQAGAIEQQNMQAQLDAARATELQKVMTPYQQLSFVSDIYKGAPGTQMSLTAGSAPSASPFQQVAGTITGGITAAAAANKLF